MELKQLIWEKNIDIIGAQETWISDETHIPYIRGYRTTSTKPSKNKARGIIMFIKDTISIIDAKIHEYDEGIEMIECTIREKRKQIILVNIYIYSSWHKN